MLSKLYISNYALIDQLTIDFDRGLTIITGETGAGKSIIMGALSLILGERADAHAVRDKASKVVVEATFDIVGFDLASFFSDNDIEYYEHECIVRREISASGRSRSFVNDTPVVLSVLKDLAARLVDLHSQHNNMLLSKPQYQLQVLDSIAADADELAQYRCSYHKMKQLLQDLNEARDRHNRNKADEDYISFQLKQLAELNLEAGEDETLEALQNRLANVAESKETLWRAESVLNGDEDSVIVRLGEIAQGLEVTEPNLPEIAGLAERTRSAIIELKDIAETASRANGDLSDDPQQLQQVSDRLDAIYSLERKHNVGSSDELLQLQHKFEQQISEIDNGDDHISELERLLAEQEREVTQIAAQLTKLRKAAAQRFAEELKRQAQGLGMQNIQFTVDFKDVDFNANGADAVDYLVAFNKNQQPMPVKDTASGGEISRLMLCIKSIIARSMNLPTIIFDEVDTGVSGDVASRIGEMMGEIAGRIQVIAITHLPQVAAHASQHLMVFKTDLATSTVTQVKKLSDEEHVLEIARMLSGKNVEQAAISNARSLIKACRQAATKS